MAYTAILPSEYLKLSQ